MKLFQNIFKHEFMDFFFFFFFFLFQKKYGVVISAQHMSTLNFSCHNWSLSPLPLGSLTNENSCWTLPSYNSKALLNFSFSVHLKAASPNFPHRSYYSAKIVGCNLILTLPWPPGLTCVELQIGKRRLRKTTLHQKGMVP